MKCSKSKMSLKRLLFWRRRASSSSTGTRIEECDPNREPVEQRGELLSNPTSYSTKMDTKTESNKYRRLTYEEAISIAKARINIASAVLREIRDKEGTNRRQEEII